MGADTDTYTHIHILTRSLAQPARWIGTRAEGAPSARVPIQRAGCARLTDTQTKAISRN